MANVSPETQSVLDDLKAERKALKAFKEDFEHRKALEYAAETKSRTERIHALVGQAFEMGASKYKIGQHYMTKDARTISELVATAPSWKSAPKSTTRPTFEFPSKDSMIVRLQNVDLDNIGYPDTYTGTLEFTWDDSDGSWDYSTDLEGDDLRVAGLISDVLATQSDARWVAEYHHASGVVVWDE